MKCGHRNIPFTFQCESKMTRNTLTPIRYNWRTALFLSELLICVHILIAPQVGNNARSSTASQQSGRSFDRERPSFAAENPFAFVWKQDDNDAWLPLGYRDPSWPFENPFSSYTFRRFKVFKMRTVFKKKLNLLRMASKLSHLPKTLM
jgi:hypothetical protein